MSAAELSLAARVDGITRVDVLDALWERRALVKTWTLRGTLHLHPAEELHLWTGAVRAASGPRWEHLDLEPRAAEGAVMAIVDALDGRALLRQELAREVGVRVGSWARERLASGWGHLVGDAALAGLVCHGPPLGQRVTFVRTDQWLPAAPAVDDEDALREAARRFLGTYGPSVPARFADWLAPQMGAARAGEVFAALDDELEEVELEGTRAWRLAAAGAVGAPPPPPVRLLPEYDCFVMGFRERDRLLPEAARALAKAHPKGRLEGPGAVPWLLAGGAAAGSWRRARSGRRVTVSVTPLARVSARRRRDLERECNRLGAFLGADATLELAA